jgi:thiamine biosynthesis lipoprotein
MSKLFALVLLIISQTTYGQPRSSTKVLSLMGSRFEIVAVHENDTVTDEAIEEAISEIRRIEDLISSWKPDSETSMINRNAGIAAVHVSEELFNLIERAKKISDLTDGAFDISFASADRIWTFDGCEMATPDSALVLASVRKINYKNIVLNRNGLTVFLTEKNMKIGFGAMGKGYAANMAMQIMKKHGITSGLVNAGGDLTAWGNNENRMPWQIGIADPSKKKEYIGWLTVANMSVVTSGNYEKYVIVNGEKLGHIINPKTGYPVLGIRSVTVVSPDAELSDALATSVFVLGTTKGLELINKLKNVECLIIDDDNKLWTSDKLELNYY